MVRVRMISGAATARFLTVVGGCSLTTGVGMLWGVAVALVVAGVCTAAYGLLLVDVDRDPGREVRR